MGEGVGQRDQKIDEAALGTGPAILGLAASDWPRVAVRVDEYLGAMGITAPPEVEVLRERVRRRAEGRAAATPLEDPIEAAIEEVGALFDRWLAAELGDEADADTLCAARAAVLGGAVPGWGSRWAGLASESLAAAIRAAIRVPVPERAPLAMEPSRIDLCCYRLRRLLAVMRDRLFRRMAGHAASAGGAP